MVSAGFAHRNNFVAMGKQAKMGNVGRLHVWYDMFGIDNPADSRKTPHSS
jgi:hypothetical protein